MYFSVDGYVKKVEMHQGIRNAPITQLGCICMCARYALLLVGESFARTNLQVFL